MPEMNLANILTIARLCLLPVIIVLIALPVAWAAWTCLALYAIAAFTDFLDGWVARRYNMITEWGKFMDPISDKIFVVIILLMLIVIDRIDGLWVLPVMIILVREFLVSGLREFLGPKDVKLPVTSLAKWKTASQMLSLGFLIVAEYVPYGLITGLVLLSVSSVLTAITGYTYLREGFKHIN